MSFDGRVVLVTGAASGIGQATAERFARFGATVVLSDIADEAGERAATAIVSNQGKATFIRCDVSDSDEVAELMRRIDDEFGRLDFAFNNAGIEGDLLPLADGTLENWHRVMAINLSSVFYCMRVQIPLMKRNGGGVIVNCSSIAGLVGTAGGGVYCASKHGMVGLSKAAALDYARDGIRVNAICPGVINTSMVQRVIERQPEMKKVIEEMEPVGRFGSPEEVAAAVTWLCQPESAFVTGIALPVDGGLTAR
jgi:NAD(P)-dependent dehydrogenase (short-subunit alcohol dehydrogenase family)